MLPASAPLPVVSASISLALLGDGRDALVLALRGLLDREPLRGRVLAHWLAQDVPLAGEGEPVAVCALVLTSEDTTAVTPPQHLDRYDAIVLCAGIGSGSGSGSGSGNKLGVPHHHRTTTIAQLLRNAALPHSVLQGKPASQARQCLGLAEHLARRKGWMWPLWQQSAPASARRWLGVCEKCSDPDCEHRLFSGLMGQRNDAS